MEVKLCGGGGYVLRVQRLTRSKTMIGMSSLVGLDEKKLWFHFFQKWVWPQRDVIGFTVSEK